MSRILIVDDDNFTLQLISAVCTKAGHQVTSALDGVEALERVAETSPDLILLDLMLPRLDGFGVLAELQADATTQRLPVIMITARADTEIRVKAMDLGVDDFLNKPFRMEDLRARIDSVLARRALEVELNQHD